jgi:hypothetical protein
VSTPSHLDSDWAFIERLLPPSWRSLAESNGVRLDPRPEFGGKVQDLSVLLRLILHHVCTASSLEVTTSLAAALGIIDISPVALHKWMKKAGDWLAAIVTEMTDATTRFAADRWAGLEIIAADATTVQRPGAKTATARIHTALRIADLRSIAIHVTGVDVGETLRNFEVRERQLWLLDRGYCNANSVAHAVQHGAHVLTRFCIGPMPLFDAKGHAVDARALMRRSKKIGETKEHEVFVRSELGFIRGRLLITRLPKDAVDKARHRLVKERGKKHVTADANEQAAFVMLFTTVPERSLSTVQIAELYRLRWQVELDVKRDKSIGGLDKLPNFRPDTIHTWLCAMMLGRQLGQRLATTSEPFPPSIVGHYALSAPLSALAHREIRS